MKYVTIASTFSGNKGAASMLEASIQTITKKDADAEFTVFTIYPEEDAKFNTYSNVKILGAKPLFLGGVLNPLSFLYKILPPLRPLLRKQRHIKTIAEADVFLDQGGITFVDGRSKFLIYNVATILPALFIGSKVVKCSQAMGPFSGVNKVISKIILPKVHTICARGSITYKYLKELKLNNVIESTDYAFLMEINQNETSAAKKIIKRYELSRSESAVAIMPSEVVRKKADSNDQNYVTYNTEFIKFLLKNKYKVLLMAYSGRANTEALHNNDLPVCRAIAKDIVHKNFVFIDEELSAQQLRYIIGETDAVVTSRFHAMIAALSMGVPPLVVGWSHKYAEIMKMFKMEEVALESRVLDQIRLQRTFVDFVKKNKQYRGAINEYFSGVRKSAQRQVDAILKATKN